MPRIAPHGEPPVAANTDTPVPSQTSISPVLPSQNTIRPSPMSTGPSGKPRPDASCLPCTAVSVSAQFSLVQEILEYRSGNPAGSSGLREVEILEVEVIERLAHPRRGIARELGAVRVERADERRDDV